MVKVAKEKNDKPPSYLGSMVALAPATVIQSAFEYPKGFVDKKIESSITKIPGKASKRGLGRAAGRLGAGLVTTPLFVSGIKDLKNAETKEEKQKGMAKIIGAGAAFSGAKGGIESAIETGSIRKALSKVKDVATVRGLIGAAAAAGTGYSIAQNLKSSGKSQKRKKSESDYITQALPTAAAGAAIGATKGGLESAYLNRSNLNKFIKNPRLFLGPVAGRAAAGALGAVVLEQVAKKTMDKLGSVSLAVSKIEQAKNDGLFDSPGSLYIKTKMWAANNDELKVKAAYSETIRRGAERSPSSRAVYYALHENLESRGYENLPQPKLRDKVSPIQSRNTFAESAGIITASLLAPHVVSSALESIDSNQKDSILKDALDSIAATNGIDVYDTDDKGFWEKFKIPESIGPHTGTFEDGKQYIASPKNRSPEYMAHELGHALAGDLRKNLLQTDQARKIFKYGKMLNVIVPMAVVATSADLSFSTKEEREAKANLLNKTGIIGTAMMAPVLTEEALASIKATKLMTKAQIQTNLATKGVADVSGSVISSAKRAAKLLPAFGTYAGAAAIPFLLAKYIQKEG